MRTTTAVLGGVLILALAGAGAYSYRQRQETRRLATAQPVPSFAPYVKPPRPWRWPTEGEWVVHEVVRGEIGDRPEPEANQRACNYTNKGSNHSSFD